MKAENTQKLECVDPILSSNTCVIEDKDKFDKIPASNNVLLDDSYSDKLSFLLLLLLSWASSFKSAPDRQNIARCSMISIGPRLGDSIGSSSSLSRFLED